MPSSAFLDGNVKDQNGVPVSGALVYIYDIDGDLSPVENEAGEPASNPITTGEDGYWSGFLAQEGTYTAYYSWGGRTRRIDANLIAGRSTLAVVANARDIAISAPYSQYFTSVGAGEAATATGLAFVVDNGDETVTWYRRTGGGSEVIYSPVTGAEVDAKAGISDSRNVYWAMNATNPLAYVHRIDSVADGKQVDGFFAGASFTGVAGAGYGFHAVVSGDASVPFGNAGAIGGAIGGDLQGSAIVGNRRDAGYGFGGAFTRLEDGDGGALLAAMNGTGTGPAALIVKQNDTGIPGGSTGAGSAIVVINRSEAGFAIESTTEANNASVISNAFTRQNITTGIIARLSALLGGVRTGFFIALDIVLQPATAWSGAGAVTGQTVSLSANITGSVEVTGVSVANASAGNAAAYGFVGNSTGANTLNVGAQFAASGGTTNFSIRCTAGIAEFDDGVRATLTSYADNAAAISGGLLTGDFYRTATGQVMVVF